MSIVKYIPGACLALGLGGLSACGAWSDAGDGASSMQRFVIGAPGAFRLPADDVWPSVPATPSGRSARPLATPVPAPSTSPTSSVGGGVVLSPADAAGGGGSGGGGSGGGGVIMRPAVAEEALPGLQLGVAVAPGGFADPAASVSAEVLEVAP
jgi:hypothetical protein